MGEQEKRPRRRVKKIKGGGHHGGAWKVAYADFVTAMMALFLVLWLVSQADVKLKQSIANYFRAPGVFDTLQGGIIEGPRKVSKEPSPLTSKDEEQALFNTAELLRKKFETRPEFGKYKEQIKIEVTDEGLRIQILDQAERVSFPSSSAQLTTDATAILTTVAQGICELPNPIQIGGHTDRHLYPPGSTYTNWELSADRANAARRALEAGCVKTDQIRRIVGYADTQLFVPQDPYAAANRRISIIVMRFNGASAGHRDVAAGESISPDSRKEPQPESVQGDKEEQAAKDGSKTIAMRDAGKKADAAKAGETPGSPESKTSVRPVDLGEPDKIPQNVRRTREKAPPAILQNHR